MQQRNSEIQKISTRPPQSVELICAFCGVLKVSIVFELFGWKKNTITIKAGEVLRKI